MAAEPVMVIEFDEVMPFADAKRAFEGAYVESLLEITAGHVSEAATLAGKERKDFYDLMRRADVDPADFR